jgi:hypothetical protein
MLDREKGPVMQLAVGYIAVTHGPKTEDLCSRFAHTYYAYPPDYPHDLYILCNGGPLPKEIGLLFAGLKPNFWLHKNDAGRDLSAYRAWANDVGDRYDAMLFLGESVYFHRAGWLKRLADAWIKHGPGMYGLWSSNLLRPHLQTTGFMCPQQEIAGWPTALGSKEERYSFEHGPHALWRKLYYRGWPVRLVTWDGEYEPMRWRKPANILWRGDQRNCLAWNNHTDRWFQANEADKKRWSRWADGPFR